MKKIVILLVAGLFAAIPLTSSFAKAAPEKTEKTAVKGAMVKGEIQTIDTTKNVVVVKDQTTGKDMTITVAATDIGALKVGEKVRIKYNPDTNVAESVKKIVPTVHSKKK